MWTLDVPGLPGDYSDECQSSATRRFDVPGDWPMVLARLLLAVVLQTPVPSEIAGRVVDAEGKPVEGAEVLVDLAAPVAPGRPGLSHAKSEPQGRFRIALPPPEDVRQ